MSFAKDVKMQIIKKPLENDCCFLAFFSGFLRACGDYDKTEKIITFPIDFLEFVDFANFGLTKLYGNNAKIKLVNEFKHKTKTYFRYSLPPALTTQMLQDFELLSQTGEYDIGEVNETIFQGVCCEKSFLKGFFIGAGTSGIKLADSGRIDTGYDIEFVSHSHELLLFVSHILANYNLSPKLVMRKNHYVLYIKESSQVVDLLAFLDAFESVIALQDELSLRELRNKVNRQVNCTNANITKMVDASFREVKAIETIIDTVGIFALPEDLQDVALLRFANQEESLNDLLKLSLSPLTKSALNHRLKKLIKIAENLK